MLVKSRRGSSVGEASGAVEDVSVPLEGMEGARIDCGREIFGARDLWARQMYARRLVSPEYLVKVVGERSSSRRMKARRLREARLSTVERIRPAA